MAVTVLAYTIERKPVGEFSTASLCPYLRVEHSADNRTLCHGYYYDWDHVHNLFKDHRPRRRAKLIISSACSRVLHRIENNNNNNIIIIIIIRILVLHMTYGNPVDFNGHSEGLLNNAYGVICDGIFCIFGSTSDILTLCMLSNKTHSSTLSY